MTLAHVTDGDPHVQAHNDERDVINTRAPLDSPIFTGNPEAPTQVPLTNDESLANTAYVDAAVSAQHVVDINLFCIW